MKIPVLINRQLKTDPMKILNVVQKTIPVVSVPLIAARIAEWIGLTPNSHPPTYNPSMKQIIIMNCAKRCFLILLPRNLIQVKHLKFNSEQICNIIKYVI